MDLYEQTSYQPTHTLSRSPSLPSPPRRPTWQRDDPERCYISRHNHGGLHHLSPPSSSNSATGNAASATHSPRILFGAPPQGVPVPKGIRQYQQEQKVMMGASRPSKTGEQVIDRGGGGWPSARPGNRVSQFEPNRQWSDDKDTSEWSVKHPDTSISPSPVMYPDTTISPSPSDLLPSGLRTPNEAIHTTQFITPETILRMKAQDVTAKLISDFFALGEPPATVTKRVREVLRVSLDVVDGGRMMRDFSEMNEVGESNRDKRRGGGGDSNSCTSLPGVTSGVMDCVVKRGDVMDDDGIDHNLLSEMVSQSKGGILSSGLAQQLLHSPQSSRSPHSPTSHSPQLSLSPRVGGLASRRPVPQTVQSLPNDTHSLHDTGQSLQSSISFQSLRSNRHHSPAALQTRQSPNSNHPSVALTPSPQPASHSPPPYSSPPYLRPSMTTLPQTPNWHHLVGIGGPHFSPPTMLAHPDEFKNPSSFLKIYGDPLCMLTNQGASFTSSITPTLLTSSITPTSLTSSITPTSLNSTATPATSSSLSSTSTMGRSVKSEHSQTVLSEDLHLLSPNQPNSLPLDAVEASEVSMSLLSPKPLEANPTIPIVASSPIKGKNGNWICSRCSNINFPRRFRCNKCSEGRSDEGDEIVREYAKTVYLQFLKLYRQNQMSVMDGVSVCLPKPDRGGFSRGGKGSVAS
eukprot:GHVN01022637.1.p1 GENE.GHVN01022637.1~~GHVN01022637.1.p1  ORF type:complete len:687 (-),score=201.62 GHVN01022637.1:229-2289(-)